MEWFRANPPSSEAIWSLSNNINYAQTGVLHSLHLVALADQPYGNFVRNLMEVQDFPEDAPRPCDDVAWTFPLMYNVTVHEVGDPAVLESHMTAVNGAFTPASVARSRLASLPEADPVGMVRGGVAAGPVATLQPGLHH